MKNRILKILTILWTIFCLIGVLSNFSKYQFGDWIVIIVFVSTPYIIMWLKHKKSAKIEDITPENISPTSVDVLSEPHSPTYIETKNAIYKTDGNPISDKEIPYLIEITKQQAMEQCEQSKNPKFHRTFKEEELSFSFSQRYDKQISILEDEIYQSTENIGKAGIHWMKNATKEELLCKIALCDNAIEIFEKCKRFCYSKGKGGMIYFQDTWEYCHNNKNECFSFIDMVVQLKAQLEKYL